MRFIKIYMLALGISVCTSAMSASYMPEVKDYKDKGPVARCMAMHRYVASNHNNLFLDRQNAQTEFERGVFSEKELELIKSKVIEWQLDPENVTTYKKLNLGDSAGWSLSPAIYLATCISALSGG